MRRARDARLLMPGNYAAPAGRGHGAPALQKKQLPAARRGARCPRCLGRTFLLCGTWRTEVKYVDSAIRFHSGCQGSSARRAEPRGSERIWVRLTRM
jgi:hypothetical protein